MSGHENLELRALLAAQKEFSSSGFICKWFWSVCIAVALHCSTGPRPVGNGPPASQETLLPAFPRWILSFPRVTAGTAWKALELRNPPSPLLPFWAHPWPLGSYSTPPPLGLLPLPSGTHRSPLPHIPWHTCGCCCCPGAASREQEPTRPAMATRPPLLFRQSPAREQQQ